jgi:hypothetical protein
MNTTRLEVLLGLYFDGEISALEIAELDACLRTDSDARALFLSHADAHASLRALGARNAGMRQWQAAAPALRTGAAGTLVRFAVSALRHPWIAAAAGLMLGLVVGSSGRVTLNLRGGAMAGERSTSGPGQIVEAPEVLPHSNPVLVTEVALGAEGWEGNFTEAVGKDRCERGAGESCAHMFRMVAQGANSSQGRPARCGFLRRLIDLRPYRDGFSDGKATVELSGLLNAIGGVPKQGEFCSVAMYAFDESTLAQATLPSGDVSEDALMVAKKETRRLDADPATWERVLAALSLPSTADYLLVRIDVGGDGAGGGRYLDDIRLDITRSEPMP